MVRAEPGICTAQGTIGQCLETSITRSHYCHGNSRLSDLDGVFGHAPRLAALKQRCKIGVLFRQGLGVMGCAGPRRWSLRG